MTTRGASQGSSYSSRTILVPSLSSSSSFSSSSSNLNTENSAANITLLKVKKKKCVKWNEDTVDNEMQNKKSSKSCCIYHKPRAFGESSSESSGSGDEESIKNGEGKKKSKDGGS